MGGGSLGWLDPRQPGRMTNGGNWLKQSESPRGKPRQWRSLLWELGTRVWTNIWESSFWSQPRSTAHWPFSVLRAVQ